MTDCRKSAVGYQVVRHQRHRSMLGSPCLVKAEEKASASAAPVFETALISNPESDPEELYLESTTSIH